MSDKQLHILKHSTAWPKCYRNYYAAGDGSEIDCEALVHQEMMEEFSVGWSPDRMFRVTAKGKEYLRSLDNER